MAYVFVRQILSNFHSFRFLVPAFSVSKMIGVLLSLLTSAMIIVVILRGNFNDKGTDISDHFHDLAHEAHQLFKDMFTEVSRRSCQTPATKLE
jgi:hypothetical protein